MKSKFKLIIDTDIGDDIDDAFALLLAMKLDIDIIGITTVFQNTDERSRIAKKITMLFGNGYEKVPIYSGYKTPLSKFEKQYPHLCQYTEELESEIYAPTSSNEEDAIDFIIDSCKRYGEDLIVLAIGPFTNIAKVISKYPDALNSISKVVIMGGAFFKQYVDWNVICDVEAAKIMFDNVKNIHCLGADVTHQLKISEDDDKIITEYSGENEAVKYISELYRMWKKSANSIGVLHDPLAVYYIIDNTICESDESSVAVIDSGLSRGLTLNVKAYSKSYLNEAYRDFDFSKMHTLAKTVDRDKMIKSFMKCFE